MNKSLLLFFLLAVCLIKAAVAQEVTPVPRAYTIGPGDEITIKVLGEKDFDTVAVVDENGNIELPSVDKSISAMCKTERELRDAIADALRKYIRSPQVGLSVVRKSRPPVTVAGEINKQQQVDLMRRTRLWELITFSGGITEDAGGTVVVSRRQPPLCAAPEELQAWKADTQIYKISEVQTGDERTNPIIYPGDMIVVEKGKPIYLVGEVKGGQGGLMIKEGGLPLTRAIAMSGGVTREAKSKDIKIYRVKPNTMEKEIISANLDLIKKNQQQDIMLEPYDVVEVDRAKPSVLSSFIKTATGIGTSGLGTVVTGGLSRAVLY